MKDIKDFCSIKYSNNGKKNEYKLIEKGIYEKVNGKSKLYVTSLSFIQEPIYGEGNSAEEISQYPLEDILDKFYCHISDFYDELNTKESKSCYLEFASYDKKDIMDLRGIIGKHVYNKTVGTEVKLIIE